MRDRVSSPGPQYTLSETSSPLSFSNNPRPGFALEDLHGQGKWCGDALQTSVDANFEVFDRAYLNTYFS